MRCCRSPCMSCCRCVAFCASHAAWSASTRRSTRITTTPSRRSNRDCSPHRRAARTRHRSPRSDDPTPGTKPPRVNASLEVTFRSSRLSRSFQRRRRRRRSELLRLRHQSVQLLLGDQRSLDLVARCVERRKSAGVHGVEAREHVAGVGVEQVARCPRLHAGERPRTHARDVLTGDGERFAFDRDACRRRELEQPSRRCRMAAGVV